MQDRQKPVKQYNVRQIKVENETEARRELAQIGCDDWGIKLMAPKAVFRVLKVSGLTPVQANILKQEMLARGGEAAVRRGVANHSVDSTDVLLMGTVKQFKALLVKLRLQPFDLPNLAAQIREVLDGLKPRGTFLLDCRGRQLEIGRRTLVMGILNVTPDSFSDGGRFFEPERALQQAQRLVAEGADIIDLGGVSTRPGHTPVPVEEELRRILPVLRLLLQHLDVPISVDTFTPEVARAALEEGAHILNDQWALQRDPAMAGVAARYQVPVVLMHNQQGTQYRDLMGDMLAFFRRSIDIAVQAGLPRHQLIIDPGIGFGKTLAQNLEVMRRLSELATLGLPVLLGTSRKSMIGKTLDLPVDQRVEGTAATVALGIAHGVDIVRVHDVKEMVRVARMTDAMVRGPAAVGVEHIL
ncbi:MAG: dihydropteroate synthase [Desulfurispora sp.]|uniref:dihydropteroate synthase n=1 Tax=Desulfurispora sp. TaxID=3014275 RepID=UPI00404A2792